MDIWKKCRQETPGSTKYIHFNNAGASLIAQPVLDVVLEYQQKEAEIGGYELERIYAKELATCYQAAADLIGAKSNEIALMPNATTAWNRAFYAIPWRQGDRILCSPLEYSSNFMAYLQLKERLGIEIDIIPYQEATLLPDLEIAEALIQAQTRLLSITYLPSHIGLLQPVDAFGELAKKYNLYYLLDACQAVGHIPIDVKKIGCDFLSTTGRKFLRAPRGTGFLYVKQSRLEELEPYFMDTAAAEWISPDTYQLRNDARRLESWEGNRATQLGLTVALDYAQNIGLEVIQKRVTYLANQLKNGLMTLPQVRLSETGKSQSGIVSFDVMGQNLANLQVKLQAQQINTSIAVPSVSRIDIHHRGFDTLLRTSLHYYNTEDEIIQFLDAMKKLI